MLLSLKVCIHFFCIHPRQNCNLDGVFCSEYKWGDFERHDTKIARPLYDYLFDYRLKVFEIIQKIHREFERFIYITV